MSVKWSWGTGVLGAKGEGYDPQERLVDKRISENNELEDLSPLLTQSTAGHNSSKQ